MVKFEDNEKWCSDCKHQGGTWVSDMEVDVWCNHPDNESRDCDYNENGDCKYYEEI